MTNLAPNYRWSSTILDYLQCSATLAKLSWLVKISKMKTYNICCSGYKRAWRYHFRENSKFNETTKPVRTSEKPHLAVPSCRWVQWSDMDCGRSRYWSLCTNYSRMLIISTLRTNYSQTPRRRTARRFLCSFHFWWLGRGSLHFARGISKMVVSTNWTFIQQESIPVGCIPPAYMFQFQLPPLAVTSRAWVGITTRCH